MSEPALDLGKKVGPFPIGSWLAIGAVGVAGGLILRRFTKSAPAAPEAPAAPDPLSVPLRGTVPLSGGAGATPAPVVGDPKPTDNQQWVAMALRHLIAQGHDSVTAQQALTLFINGQPLTTQQRALVALALDKFGAPPMYVPPASTTPTPTPNPTPSLPPARKPTAQWISYGVERLAAGGYDPRGEARTVLTRYVNGQPVTRQQAALVEMALQFNGGKPDPTPPLLTYSDNPPAGTGGPRLDQLPPSNVPAPLGPAWARP